MNKIIIIHKEKGMTSRDVVNVVSKKLKIKKIGHTGTLDPMAEGVLVLLTGKYTKLNDLLVSTKKEYIATVKMGVLTDTLDMDGKIVKEDHRVATKEQLVQLFQNFPKTYLQEVPFYSAVKVKGKRLYEYARRGDLVLLPKRQVILYDLELLDVSKDTFTFKTTVSKGTYIRSLIRDLGKELNLFFTMTKLVRTRQGIFKLEDAILLKDLDETYKGPSLEDVLEMPIEIVDDEKSLWIRNGRKLQNPYGYQRVLFLTPEKVPLAIYQKDGSLLKIDKMLGE